MASEPSGPLERWRALNSVHARVLHALDRALERDHGISACELDVLQHLAARRSGLRIQDLSEQVLRSHSALSRMVARLERELLVERSVDPSDRRGVIVRTTPAGRKRMAAAEQTQRKVLAEALPEPLVTELDGRRRRARNSGVVT